MPGRDLAPWSARLALAALAAVTLLAALVPAATVSAVDECAQADRLLDGGSLADLQLAETAYREILAATPESACAKTGDQVATSLITAVDLHRAGLNNSVSTHIVAALKLRPQTRLPAELSDDGAVHRAPWQSEAWLTWQDRVVIALGGLLVLVLLWPFASWVWRWARYGRRGGRLLIGTFTGADGVSGSGFAAVVGDHVQRLGDFRSGQRPDRVSKWGDPVAVPAELVTAVPPVGLFNAVVGLVGRAGQGSDRSLGGTLHASGECVVGVSLTLETRQSRVVDGCGVWSSAYALPPSDAAPLDGSGDRPEVLYPLAYPVAVWAFWKLTPDAWRLGTSQWQSYALFGMGEDFDAYGQVEQAERCYLRALAVDPENLPARLNLASMWLMSSTGSVTGEAATVLGGHDEVSWAERELGRIQRAAAHARERPGGGSEPDSFWYRAQYVLAASAARRHLEEWGSGPLPGRLGASGEAAVELTDDLAEHIEVALAERRAGGGPGGRRRPPDPAFTSFLEDIEAAALILWAGVDLVRRTYDPGAPRNPALRLRFDGAPLTIDGVLAACDSGRLCMPSRARYNLACYHAVAAMIERRAGRSDHAHRDAALLQLQLAVPSLVRSTLDHAMDDRCFFDLRDDPRFAAVLGVAPAGAHERRSAISDPLPGTPPAARTSAAVRSPR